MDLYPAVDIRGGLCVRLSEGDFDRETIYGTDPVARALAFAEAGAGWVHIVDLDAARTGEPVNRDVILAIAKTLDIPIQVGGGVRSEADAEALLGAGVARVVIGTAALENPGLVGALSRSWPGAVAVGIDHRDGDVKVRGWREGAGRALGDVVLEMEEQGAGAFIVTDISRDGLLVGPDVEGLSELLSMTSVPLIASGGVGSADDLSALSRVEVNGRRLAGAIVGRAIYEGKVDIAQALTACGIR